MVHSQCWKSWGKHFRDVRKFWRWESSWHSDDSTSARQLGPDFVNRVAQLVTYCLLVMHMNMVDHKAKVLNWIVLLNIKYYLIYMDFAILHMWHSCCWLHHCVVGVVPDVLKYVPIDDLVLDLINNAYCGNPTSTRPLLGRVESVIYRRWPTAGDKEAPTTSRTQAHDLHLCDQRPGHKRSPANPRWRESSGRGGRRRRRNPRR